MKKMHITLEEGQKIFFTSDLHVGHRNVINFCNRPFADVKDMDQKLIENWNSAVGENDIVFDLGDMFWFDGRHEVKKFVNRLNGKIYKIAGNHDVDSRKLFELCDPEKVTVLDDIAVVWITGAFPEPTKTQEVWLCHFPLATFPHFERAIQLFGHIHSGPVSDNKVDIPGKDLILKEKRQYDVGVDNNDYTPVEFREILRKLELL